MIYCINGMLFSIDDNDPNAVSFDVVMQLYCLKVKQYRCIDYWRRDSGRILIQSADLYVYVSTATPHVVRLYNEGVNEIGICKELKGRAADYTSYALNNTNVNIINGVVANRLVLFDRIEKEDVHKVLNVQPQVMGGIEFFSAY